jgi:hypothetical protein
MILVQPVVAMAIAVGFITFCCGVNTVGSFVIFGVVSIVIAGSIAAGYSRKLFNRANEVARTLALAQRSTRWDQMDLHELR